jgi:sec-independent protein translocase protein TatB
LAQVFGNLGLPEILLLAVVGLLVFGPERLPRAAADAGRMIKSLRALSHQAMNEVKDGFGPEMADLDLRSLHPRRFLTDQLLGDDPPEPE